MRRRKSSVAHYRFTPRDDALKQTIRLDPTVFWRITHNWLEITVRFLAPDHGVRRIKDAITRDFLAALDPVEAVIASERQEQVTGPTLDGR